MTASRALARRAGFQRPPLCSSPRPRRRREPRSMRAATSPRWRRLTREERRRVSSPSREAEKRWKRDSATTRPRTAAPTNSSCSLFGGGLGVGLGIANDKGGLVFGHGFLAIGHDVVKPAKIDVRPGEGAGILRGIEDLLEVSDGGSRLTLHEVDASEDVVGLGVVT